MVQTRLERLSIRAVLVLGIAVTLGLWLFTGLTFKSRMDDVERRAAVVTAKYTHAQGLLTTVRTEVLAIGARVRDALLNPEPATILGHQQRIDASYAATIKALQDYVPVVDSDAERDRISRLRLAVEEFHGTARTVLAEASVDHGSSAVNETLNRDIVPRREAASRLSEEIQSRNQYSFIEQQAEIAEIHRVAEREGWTRLGVALAISLSVGLLAALYAGQLESRLRRQMDRETGISRELQDVASRLMSAQEDERRTIARELHDEVGQVLGAIKVELSIAQRALEARGESGDALAEAQTITDGALQTVRDMSQLLRPSMLDDLGLPAAIDASLRNLARRHDIRAELQQSGMDERLDPETEVAAYRIVQEALSNIARHSGASHCWVRLSRRMTAIRLEIEDDGSGFDPSSKNPAVAERRGLGLIGIRERIAHLGGTLDLRSAPGRGTCVTVELPAGAAVA